MMSGYFPPLSEQSPPSTSVTSEPGRFPTAASVAPDTSVNGGLSLGEPLQHGDGCFPLCLSQQLMENDQESILERGRSE